MSAVTLMAPSLPEAVIESMGADPRPVEIGTRPLEQAAIRIQALIRGVLSRKSLPSSFYFERQYGKLIRITWNLEHIEHTTATSGHTPVWFPKAYPDIVMKFSRVSSPRRLAVMNDIRNVLKTQGSSHAIVPVARMCERYRETLLVEERLPINTDQYYNMWLYLHNWKAFDHIVQELVRLYSERGGLSDLGSSYGHPLMQLEGVRYGIRFDNFPLYLNKKGEGCVGLIDLESMGEVEFLRGCQMLARIFPFQRDLILVEAEKCGQALSQGSIDRHAWEGMQALKVGIQRHEAWLLNKIKTQSTWVDTSNPIASLSRDRKMELIALVKQMLLKSHEKEGMPESSNCYILKDTPMVPMRSESQPPLPPGILYNPLDTKVDVEWMFNPEIDLAHPEISADTLATGITLFVIQYFANALLKEGKIPSFKTCKKGREWAVIRARSPTIEFRGLFRTIERMIAAHQRRITERFVDIEEEMRFPPIKIVDIIDAVMRNLISQGDIFSCDISGSDSYWLRY